MLTLIEAAKLSRNPLASGALEAIATSDELISQIGFTNTLGEAISYNREKTLPTVEFVAPDHTSIAESSATFDLVTVPLRLMVSDTDVYSFSANQQSEQNNQRAMQVTQKLKALGRSIGQKIVTGAYASGATVTPAIGGVTVSSVGPNQDSSRWGHGTFRFTLAGTLLAYRAPGDRFYGTEVNVGSDGAYTLTSENPNKWIRVTVVAASLPGANASGAVAVTTSSNEFDGLLTLIPTTHSQSIAATGATGDALSFAVMDQMLDEKVKSRNNLVWMGNAKIKGKLLALQRALGGTTPDNLKLPGMNTPVPQYRGVPFIQNDWIPSNEVKGAASTLSSLFLVDLSMDGLSMVVGSQGMAETVDTSPLDARVMGVSIRDIGELEAKEATRTRVSMYVTTRLGSELSVSRAINLITA